MTQELTAQRYRPGLLDSSDQPGIEQHEANRDDGPRGKRPTKCLPQTLHTEGDFAHGFSSRSAPMYSCNLY